MESTLLARSTPSDLTHLTAACMHTLPAGLFGSSKTPAEKMKEYKRNIQKSVRELDRERNSLERQEKKLMADIKKEAKAGRNDTAKIMAKDLIRTRGYIKKMYKMKSHLEAISLRLTTMQTTNQMATSMKQVSKVMGKMNKQVRESPCHRTRRQPSSSCPISRRTRAAQMNLPKIQEIMMNFEQENEKMAVKEEMMDDAMDDGAISPTPQTAAADRRDRHRRTVCMASHPLSAAEPEPHHDRRVRASGCSIRR